MLLPWGAHRHVGYMVKSTVGDEHAAATASARRSDVSSSSASVASVLWLLCDCALPILFWVAPQCVKPGSWLFLTLLAVILHWLTAEFTQTDSRAAAIISSVFTSKPSDLPFIRPSLPYARCFTCLSSLCLFSVFVSLPSFTSGRLLVRQRIILLSFSRSPFSPSLYVAILLLPSVFTSFLGSSLSTAVTAAYFYNSLWPIKTDSKTLKMNCSNQPQFWIATESFQLICSFASPLSVFGFVWQHYLHLDCFVSIRSLYFSPRTQSKKLQKTAY